MAPNIAFTLAVGVVFACCSSIQVSAGVPTPAQGNWPYPTSRPTTAPTTGPTQEPSAIPSTSPTPTPTKSPVGWQAPTTKPTKTPTGWLVPGSYPTKWPSTGLPNGQTRSPTRASGGGQPSGGGGGGGNTPVGTMAPTRVCNQSPSGLFNTCSSQQLWAYHGETLFLWPKVAAGWSAVCNLRTTFCCTGNKQVTIRLGLYLGRSGGTPGKLLVEAAPSTVQCDTNFLGVAVIEADFSTFNVTLIPGTTYWIGAVFPSSVSIRNRFRTGSEVAMLSINHKYSAALPGVLSGDRTSYDRKSFVLDLDMTTAMIASPNVAPKYDSFPLRFFQAPSSPTGDPPTISKSKGNNSWSFFSDEDVTLYAGITALVIFGILASVFACLFLCGGANSKGGGGRRESSGRRRSSSGRGRGRSTRCREGGDPWDRLTDDEYAYYLAQQQQQHRRDNRRVTWAPSLNLPLNEHAMSRT